MKLDSLKPLLHHDGPLTTVCLDATRGDESSGDREVRNRWSAMRRRLEQAGAPAGTVAAIEEVVLRPTHVAGPHGRYVVATADGQVLLDQVLPDPPARDEASHDGTPSLVPAVAAIEESVRYLLVEVDRSGANVHWSGGVGAVHNGAAAFAQHQVVQVDGGHDELHKTGVGRLTHGRFQARVQDSWERNAEAVAAELDKAVAEHRPELVVLTGDVRAVQLVRGAVGNAVADVLVEVAGGSRADGVNKEAFARRLVDVLAQHRANRRDAVVGRLRESLGRGDGAVTSLEDLVEVLRKGQVAEVVVLRAAGGASVARLNERRLWTGPDPLQIAVRRADLAALAVPEDTAREVRADIAVLRAVVAQDAGFTYAPEGSVELVDGVGALLRWSDAATPHEAAPAYTADRSRKVHRRSGS